MVGGGQVIRKCSVTDINWPIILNVRFSGNYLTAVLDDEVSITKTGMYNLFFVVCDPKLNETVMSGKTIWKNPNGYLPGRMAPLKNFYIFMAAAYLCLSIIWFLQYLRFWKDILQLQHCIIAIIVLGLFEMILWHFEYVNFNDTGIRPVVVTTWVVSVGAIRKTISRLIILSVSMGYGVVRPTLGGLTSKRNRFEEIIDLVKPNAQKGNMPRKEIIWPPVPQQPNLQDCGVHVLIWLHNWKPNERMMYGDDELNEYRCNLMWWLVNHELNKATNAALGLLPTQMHYHRKRRRKT